MRDGTASLYTSSGFGIIGGHRYSSVREAAARYVKLAEKFFVRSKAVSAFPYPRKGQVYYYLLTYDGVRLSVGDESGIRRGSDPTQPLFAAAQAVVAELRRTTERRQDQPAAADKPRR
jgi:hypothetical protein